MLDVVVADKRFHEILDVKQDLQIIAKGFVFTEGPIWNYEQDYLTFSDIPASKLYRWSKIDGLSLVRNNTNKANGNTYMQDGRILSCEHATSRVVILDEQGEQLSVLASHYQKKELNSPNDIVVSSKGVIYFTDPRFGRNPSHVGVERPLEQEKQAVYFIKEGETEPTVATDILTSPNGLCFSADEKFMYVADTPNLSIVKFEVTKSGELINPTTFAITNDYGLGRPDGLKIDKSENVICAAQGGLHFYSKDGTFLGVVKIEEQTANFCFGDSDGLGLYLTASGTIYKIRLK